MCISCEAGGEWWERVRGGMGGEGEGIGDCGRYIKFEIVTREKGGESVHTDLTGSTALYTQLRLTGVIM